MSRRETVDAKFRRSITRRVVACRFMWDFRQLWDWGNIFTQDTLKCTNFQNGPCNSLTSTYPEQEPLESTIPIFWWQFLFRLGIKEANFVKRYSRLLHDLKHTLFVAWEAGNRSVCGIVEGRFKRTAWGLREMRESYMSFCTCQDSHMLSINYGSWV